MSKSAFTDAHQILVEALTAARHATGLRQAEVAARLGKNQSFISNIERGQRRVDMIEFYALARALEVDPVDLYAKLVSKLPKTIDI